MTAADLHPAPSLPSRTLPCLLTLSGQFPSPCGGPANPCCHSGFYLLLSTQHCRWAIFPAGVPSSTLPVPCTSPLEAGAADSFPKSVLAEAWRTTECSCLAAHPFLFPFTLLLHAALHPVMPVNFPTPVAVPVAQRSHPSFGPSRLGPVFLCPGHPWLHTGPTALEDPTQPILLPPENQAAVAGWLFLFPTDPAWTARYKTSQSPPHFLGFLVVPSTKVKTGS